jgi:hypothetical protein
LPNSVETRLAEPQPIGSWKDLCDVYAHHNEQWNDGGWLFRGQSVPSDSLHPKNQLITSLERTLARFHIPLADAPLWEYRLLRDFKRRCHLITAQPPPLENDLEWMALLRHYGGPARLLDWTYSFWAGIHFAIENAEPGVTCQIWALDAQWWIKMTKFKRLKALVRKKGSNSLQESREVLRKSKRPGIWLLNPFRLNDRLAAQQGNFLLPLDITRPLADNFYALSTKRQRAKHLMLYELKITPVLLKTCLSNLQRMNITRLTLYPWPPWSGSTL